MEREEFRAKLIDGINEILSHRLLVPADAKALLRAQRRYLASEIPNEALDRMLALYKEEQTK